MASKSENIVATREKRMSAHEAKIAGVADRNRERSKRTPTEQLKRLDNLLGIGVGAVRERKRLKLQAENQYNKQTFREARPKNPENLKSQTPEVVTPQEVTAEPTVKVLKPNKSASQLKLEQPVKIHKNRKRK